MTDAKLDDKQAGEPEPVAPPTPTVTSGGSTVAGSAEPSFDADSLASKVMDRIDAILDEKVDARVKSIKDKRMAKLAKADEILAFVEASGGDVSKVKGDLVQDELLNRLDAIEQRLGSGGAVGAATRRADPDRAAEILQKAGIPFSDDEVKKWADKSFTSDAQAEIALEALVTKRAKQGNVTPAATVGSKGTPVSISGDKEELLQQLENIQEGVYGSPMSPENMEKSAKIVAKLNELDPQVDVYNDEQFFKAKQKGYSMDWFSDIPGPSGLHE